MAKIIKVELGEVFILMDDEEIVKIEEYTMNFEPKVNDLVEVYQYNDSYIVNKMLVSKIPFNKLYKLNSNKATHAIVVTIFWFFFWSVLWFSKQ